MNMKVHSPIMELQRFVEDKFKAQGEPLNECFADCIDRWFNRDHLNYEEARTAFGLLMADDVHDYQIGQFLAFTTPDFLTAEEIAGFADVLRAHACRVHSPLGGHESLGDTCGTGGDTIDTFNISTTIMFILAAAGIKIAKHGNRKITSSCGSADVLEELGVNIHLTPANVAKCIGQIGVGFMFAPEFHPATAKVQKIRKIFAEQLPDNMNKKSVFNVLGPLVNPAGAQRQMMGVYDKAFVRKMAEVFKHLGADCAVVVHGTSTNSETSKGLDEVSTLGSTFACEFKDGEITEFEITPKQLGLSEARPEDIGGGAPIDNAAILEKILTGEETGARRDIALANAAVGIYAGRADKRVADVCLEEFVEEAAGLIDSGAAHEKLNELRILSVSLGKDQPSP